MSRVELRGALTALVTPFSADGAQIDWAALERHVELQIASGITGLVPCGTTGEAPTLSRAEQDDVIARVVKVAAGRVPVLAGVGSNDTRGSVAGARAAVAAGANAVMVVVPYYTKPSQIGLQRHFEEVAGAVDVPVVLYNVPGRSVAKLEPETLFAILESRKNVVAIKDATNNVHFCQEVLAKAGDRVAILCGDDSLTVPAMSVGAVGVISVTSNVFPRQVADVVKLAAAGQFREAARVHLELLPVHEAMFCAPSPVPAKVALAARGQMNEAVRLPLVPATDKERARVAKALGRFGGTAS